MYGIVDLVNPTFWLLVTVLGVLAFSWALFCRRPRQFDGVLSAVRHALSSLPVLVFLIFANSALAGFASYMAYVAPWNIMQDIVSAQQFLQGKPLYPSDMGKLMSESMQKKPPRFSLGSLSPRLRAREARDQLNPNITVVQAHPPLMTLAFAPLVAAFGVRGTCLAVSLLSLVALFFTDWALFRGLELPLSPRQRVALMFGTLGWFPVVSTFRWGQSGILLGALIVAAWLALRGNRPVLAGMSIGLATCLKVFPGLLLVYFLFRRRRAFVAALLTMLALTGLGIAIAGWQNYQDYSAAGHFVLMRFGGYYANISLLGAVARNLGRYLGSGLYRVTQVAMAIYVAISVSLIGFLFWLLQRKPVLPAERLRELDFEYSLVVALIPLLSPLSWDHYMPVLLLPMLVLSRRILADQPNGLPVSALAGLLMALAIPAWTLHFNTRVTPETAAMLALWSWIVILYWRWKAGSAV